jgi:hypothetical protein
MLHEVSNVIANAKDGIVRHRTSLQSPSDSMSRSNELHLELRPTIRRGLQPEERREKVAIRCRDGDGCLVNEYQIRYYYNNLGALSLSKALD